MFLSKVTELSGTDKDAMDRNMVKFFTRNKEADVRLARILPDLERDKREIETLIDSYSIGLYTDKKALPIEAVTTVLGVICAIADYALWGWNSSIDIFSGIALGAGMLTVITAIDIKRESEIFALEKAYIEQRAPTIRADIRAKA
jgi:hypothetical protein